MNKNDERLRKKAFCLCYLKLGNPKEAAVLAGYPKNNALAEGIKLLEDRWVRGYIRKLTFSEADFLPAVRAGLERLAFGNISDIAELVMSEEGVSPSRLSKMDLFNISEIKKVKGGGFEVKIFDRQKALEKLLEIDEKNHGRDTAEEFFKALKLNSDSESETQYE